MIAAFEALKGAGAVIALMALALLGPTTLQHHLRDLAAGFGANIHHGNVAKALGWITPESLYITISVLGIYALMRLVEAWGLWRERAWASWLGCLSAAIYLPADGYAIVRHPGWPSAALLLVNLLVVWILARDLIQRRRELPIR